MSVNSQIEALIAQAEAEGFIKDTETFNDRLIILKVNKCQEMLNNACAECPHNFFCDMLTKATQVKLKLKQLGVKKNEREIK
jgi:hypothetical protein